MIFNTNVSGDEKDSEEDHNAGWDDEAKIPFQMSHSREGMFSQAFEGIDFTSASCNNKLVRRVNLLNEDPSTNHLRSALSILESDGVVSIRGLYNDEQKKTMLDANYKVLQVINNIQWPPSENRHSIAFDASAESCGLNYCTKHSEGRFDISPLNDNDHLGLPKYLFCPSFIRNLLQVVMSCSHWRVDSAGAIPLYPGHSLSGSWHRDTKSLFTWKHMLLTGDSDSFGGGDGDNVSNNRPCSSDEPVKSNNKNPIDSFQADALDVKMIPDYYFTMIITLSDLHAEGYGETQFLLGSHKESMLEAASNLQFASNSQSVIGDVVLFNGKIIHRGLPNACNPHYRHAFYVVYNARWYSDW